MSKEELKYQTFAKNAVRDLLVGRDTLINKYVSRINAANGNDIKISHILAEVRSVM